MKPRKKERKKGEITSKLIRLQNLQEHQVLISRILNIMTIRLREIAHITRAVIERSRRRRRREQRRAGLTLDEKRPLVTGWMPVDLAHAAGFHGHDCGGEVCGDGEGDGVDNFHRSTGDFVGGLLGEMV